MHRGLFFFFKQKTAYEMRISDWDSDVFSSDLDLAQGLEHVREQLWVADGVVVFHGGFPWIRRGALPVRRSGYRACDISGVSSCRSGFSRELLISADTAVVLAAEAAPTGAGGLAALRSRRHCPPHPGNLNGRATSELK